MRFFVVKIECDTDTSDRSAHEFKVFTEAEDAYRLFRHLNYLYQEVVPIGPGGKLNVVGGQFFDVNAADEAGAIEIVKSGRAYVINDVTTADRWRTDMGLLP